VTKLKRSTIFHISRAQKILFYPIIVAFFLGCIVSWLNLIYFFVGGYLTEPSSDWIQRAIPFLLTAAVIMMFMVIFWSFHISNQYLGPYERVIVDLDDVLSGVTKGPVKSRKGDIIFQELLKRINILIEKTK